MRKIYKTKISDVINQISLFVMILQVFDHGFQASGVGNRAERKKMVKEWVK